FFSSRRRHTRCYRDWSSDVCSSDLFLGDWDAPGRDQVLTLGFRERHPAKTPQACHRVLLLRRGGWGTAKTMRQTALAPGVVIERSEERRVGKEGRCRWAREEDRV